VLVVIFSLALPYYLFIELDNASKIYYKKYPRTTMYLILLIYLF